MRIYSEEESSMLRWAYCQQKNFFEQRAMIELLD
tara:strand:+ start:160 stop:261 length:102 start_codon:yes stop_codon:yes gene_type:complete